MLVAIPLALLGGAYYAYRRDGRLLWYSVVARLLTAAGLLWMAMHRGAGPSGLGRFGVLDALALFECMPALVTLSDLWRTGEFYGVTDT